MSGSASISLDVCFSVLSFHPPPFGLWFLPPLRSAFICFSLHASFPLLLSSPLPLPHPRLPRPPTWFPLSSCALCFSERVSRGVCELSVLLSVFLRVFVFECARAVFLCVCELRVSQSVLLSV